VNEQVLKQQSSYYQDQGIKKFGHWVDSTKTKELQELDELMGAG
jgi:hypothetical protein